MFHDKARYLRPWPSYWHFSTLSWKVPSHPFIYMMHFSLTDRFTIDSWLQLRNVRSQLGSIYLMWASWLTASSCSIFLIMCLSRPIWRAMLATKGQQGSLTDPSPPCICLVQSSYMFHYYDEVKEIHVWYKSQLCAN